MRHKQQPAGAASILLAEALVVERGNDRLTGTCGGNNQVVIIAAHTTLCIELVQDLLLIGVWLDIHCVDFGIVGVEILFRFQSASKAFFLILTVILKLIGIPVAFKGGSDLVNSLRQILFRDLYIPFKATGNRSIGKVG